jgi:hypothetical protein
MGTWANQFMRHGQRVRWSIIDFWYEQKEKKCWSPSTSTHSFRAYQHIKKKGNQQRVVLDAIRHVHRINMEKETIKAGAL